MTSNTSRWYKQAGKIVLSRTRKSPAPNQVHFVSNHIGEEIYRMKQRGAKDILSFGSPSATQSLMTSEVIDELWLFIHPIILGEGIPMFANRSAKKKLKL